MYTVSHTTHMKWNNQTSFYHSITAVNVCFVDVYSTGDAVLTSV
jgi:hypothetical protein